MMYAIFPSVGGENEKNDGNFTKRTIKMFEIHFLYLLYKKNEG